MLAVIYFDLLVSLLLSAHIKRFCGSSMPDFSTWYHEDMLPQHLKIYKPPHPPPPYLWKCIKQGVSDHLKACFKAIFILKHQFALINYKDFMKTNSINSCMIKSVRNFFWRKFFFIFVFLWSLFTSENQVFGLSSRKNLV